MVAGVGAADGGRAARVTRHPELGLETLGSAWAEETDTSAISYDQSNFEANTKHSVTECGFEGIKEYPAPAHI